jgi:hypothetical protein
MIKGLHQGCLCAEGHAVQAHHLSLSAYACEIALARKDMLQTPPPWKAEGTYRAH